MEAWMTPMEFYGYLRGNAIKYLARTGKKGDALEDLKKARHYLDRLIEMQEEFDAATRCSCRRNTSPSAADRTTPESRRPSNPPARR
jgi:hypothetical protein